MRVLDLAPIAQVAREFGLALLVDATFASPINFRPLEHGADVVITSATKYLNGHSDVIAGAVAGIGVARRRGQPPAPRAGGRRSTRTPPGWSTAACARSPCAWSGTTPTASRWPRWAETHPAIARVHYPGLASPSRSRLRRARALADSAAWWGSSSRAAPRAAERMLKRLKLIAHAPSLAGVESLVSEPRLTSHRDLTPEERAAAGIPDGFLRLSCGLEDAEDIIDDLRQALGKES